MKKRVKNFVKRVIVEVLTNMFAVHLRCCFISHHAARQSFMFGWNKAQLMQCTSSLDELGASN